MNVGGCDVFEIFFSILCDTLCVIDRDKKVEKKQAIKINLFCFCLFIFFLYQTFRSTYLITYVCEKYDEKCFLSNFVLLIKDIYLKCLLDWN